MIFQVWYAAVTQSFFSLSVGFGTLTTYSSYNKFRHNTNKDALIISFADTFTSLLAGTVIFSILGHLAHELELPVEEVVKSGAGLAFVSYPEVLAKFDLVPQVFAVLFFLMLITLGLGSAVGFMSAITTTIFDSFPHVNKDLCISFSSFQYKYRVEYCNFKISLLIEKSQNGEEAGDDNFAAERYPGRLLCGRLRPGLVLCHSGGTDYAGDGGLLRRDNPHPRSRLL